MYLGHPFPCINFLTPDITDYEVHHENYDKLISIKTKTTLY